MSDRMFLEHAVKREPKDKTTKGVLIDWLMENEYYDRAFARRVVLRIAKTARDEREVNAAYNALSGRSVFCRMLKQLIAERTGMAYGDAMVMSVIPGYRLPKATREAVGMAFLDQHVHRVWVGAKWVLKEVVEAIRFHSTLPLLSDPVEVTRLVNDFGARGRVIILDEPEFTTTRVPTTADNL
jgi:hypothetical protein